jgi:hypothetical protein
MQMPVQDDAAPGELELVRAYVNTVELESGDDELETPAGLFRWAFYDHARNRSRTWCSMDACGNRAKARAYRARRAS